MTARVTVLVPVLNRPHRIEPLAANLERVTPEPYDLLFLPTATDALTLAELERLDLAWSIAPAAAAFGVPTYSSKINHGYRITTTEFIFHAADDVQFRKYWLRRALRKLDARPEIGVLSTNDLGNARVMRGLDGTHNFVRRSYVERWGGATGDRDGNVLSEAYRHNRCDAELVHVAQRRRAFAFAAKSIVEHHHPNFGKAERDPTYALSDKFKVRDRRTYLRRRRSWA